MNPTLQKAARDAAEEMYSKTGLGYNEVKTVVEIILRHLAPIEAELPRWEKIEAAPRDGTAFKVEIRTEEIVRWHPYKPTSEQFRKGTKGRWQRINDHGGWENYELDATHFTHIPKGPGEI